MAESAVLAVIVAGHEPVRSQRSLALAAKLLRAIASISRLKVGYPDAEALHQGARELVGHLSAQRKNP